jgi:hypothetical protein
LARPEESSLTNYSLRAGEIIVPCTEAVRPMGRVAPTVVPAVDLATIVHSGSHSGIDRAYGALGAYVTQHALAIDGHIREYYVVCPSDTDEETVWRSTPTGDLRPVELVAASYSRVFVPMPLPLSFCHLVHGWSLGLGVGGPPVHRLGTAPSSADSRIDSPFKSE